MISGDNLEAVKEKLNPDWFMILSDQGFLPRDEMKEQCFDSALPGYAQHKRAHVRPECSGAKSRGLSGGGEPGCLPMFSQG